jgi:hypothetical protein
MTAFEHTDDMLIVYLPKEKILAEADAYTPTETPTTPLIAPKVRMQPLSTKQFSD